jgi:membrane protein DedA with SNARE-associated domain
MYKFLTSKISNWGAVVLSAFFCISLMVIAWYGGEKSDMPYKATLLIGFCAGLFGGLFIYALSIWITNKIIKHHESHNLSVNDKG